MTKKIIFVALCSLLVAPCSAVEAQQAGKILRIGFLDGSTPFGCAVLVDALRREMRKLGWVEERISPSSTGLPSRSLSAYLSLRRSWFV